MVEMRRKGVEEPWPTQICTTEEQRESGYGLGILNKEIKKGSIRVVD